MKVYVTVENYGGVVNHVNVFRDLHDAWLHLRYVAMKEFGLEEPPKNAVLVESRNGRDDVTLWEVTVD